MTDIFQHFKDNFILNYTSDVPLYKQIENYIVAQIRLGTFKEGDKMISENEICQLFDISRTTVRQAMNGLFEKGVIVRIRGKGTFVAKEKIQFNINNLFHFTPSIMALGLEPSSIIVGCEVITPSEEIAEKLKLLDETQKVFKLTRVRKADDVPVSLDTVYMPYYLCQGIEKMNFEHRSLFNVQEKIYQLTPKYANANIEAILIDDRITADLLEYPQNSAGFHISLTYYLEDGSIMEYTDSITRADKCSFKLTINNGKKEDLSFSKSFNL
ncbi:GntR family transcriptional regulator [Caviibacterium pharyngocola]|uniref:GntR family transcriptional regulator n=1 Tax=Caviibacterium pharyngocola TaxID=28159 RepID=A0A2M8RUS1_9PAST|nr:GntR family transcriptional regulator [Caviibacterium pharyngocola]PJG82615.1 GntR family transcriptional regulator [Caviibacterium pharyngocola]